jgi:hypothetical protein
MTHSEYGLHVKLYLLWMWHRVFGFPENHSSLFQVLNLFQNSKNAKIVEDGYSGHRQAHSELVCVLKQASLLLGFVIRLPKAEEILLGVQRNRIPAHALDRGLGNNYGCLVILRPLDS